MNQKEIISGPGLTSGPETQTESALHSEIKGVTECDLRVVLPLVGETTIILQRNAKDERNPESPNYGALTPETAEKTHDNAKSYFEQIFQGLSSEERKQIEILVVASDAILITPMGPEYSSPHKRGLETAVKVIEGAKKAMKEFGVPEKQLLNLSEFTAESEIEGPVEFEDLKDLKMLSKSPEFVDYLRNKYGAGKEFWSAYEGDKEKVKRKELDAEGVWEIAERMRAFIDLLTKGSLERHSRLANRRLIIWAVTHYDSLSPFIKVNVLKKPATDYLPINAGGGITLEINKEGEVKTEINNQKFDVRL